MKKAKSLNNAFWLYMVLSLFREIIDVSFPNKAYASALAYLLFMFIGIVLVFFTPPKNIRASVFIFVGIILLLLSNTLLFPQTSEIVKGELLAWVTGHIPLLLVLSNITLWDDFYLKMKKYAIPYFVCGVVYLLLFATGRIDEEETNYMRLAYNVLMSACVMGFIGVFEKKVLYNIIFWISLLVIFFSGCRGALLVGLCVYFSLLLFTGKASKTKKVLLLVLVVSAVFVYNFRAVENYLMSYGYESRITQKYDEGTLFESTGRELIQTMVIADVQAKGFTPQGMFADREIISRLFKEEGYVHNIVLEFIVDFGNILGIALFVMLIVLIILILKKADVIPRMYLLLYAAYSLTKLMLSSSYLIESSFFCLIGVMIAVSRSNKIIK